MDTRPPMDLSEVDADLLHTLRRFEAFAQAHSTPQWDYVQRRRWLSSQQAKLVRAPLENVVQSDLWLSAPGREIPLRHYQPQESLDKQVQRPVLVWLHGGGWMVGDLNTHDDLCERLSLWLDAHVVSVHYRRTPENPFPAALDDVMEVIHQLPHSPDLALPPHTPLLLGGDSAGAHLALAACVRMVQQSETKPPASHIAAQLLLYPPMAPQQTTPSMQSFGSGLGLTPEAMDAYWKAMGQPEASAAQWLTPGQCEAALPMLPPTLLISASQDILRDEAEAFAQRAQALGAPMHFRRANAMVHGFARLVAASPAAARIVRSACDDLRQLANI